MRLLPVRPLPLILLHVFHRSVLLTFARAHLARLRLMLSRMLAARPPLLCVLLLLLLLPHRPQWLRLRSSPLRPLGTAPLQLA